MTLSKQEKHEAFILGGTLGLYMGNALLGPIVVLFFLIHGPAWAGLFFALGTILSWIGWKKQYNLSWRVPESMYPLRLQKRPDISIPELVGADGPVKKGRPATTADIMDAAAHFLDLGDEAFTHLIRTEALIRGKQVPEEEIEDALGQSVQSDLRMIGAWLREHPEVDAEIHGLLELFPAE